MCIFSICILWVYNNGASPGDQVLSLLNVVVTMVTTKEMHINHMKSSCMKSYGKNYSSTVKAGTLSCKKTKTK